MDKKQIRPFLKTTFLTTVMAGALLASGGAWAETSVWDKAGETIDKAGKSIAETGDKLGKKISETSEKVGVAAGEAAEHVDKYVDDSTITAKVKKAIADESLSAGFDISVKTQEGIVTLTGFVPSVEMQVKAVQLASEVEGVKLVSDKLNIKTDKKVTVKDYANDAVITSEIKAKLLTADDLPLTGIKVETVDGIVQLTGSVKTTEQVYKAEQVAKQVEGVKTVKNDLAVKP